MNIIITLLLIVGLIVATPSQAKPLITDTQEWVIVLEDPRPTRLQGWQRNNYNATHYSQSLELQRAARDLAEQYDLSIAHEWMIESLEVYCIITTLNQDDQSTLDKLVADSNVRWVQASNNFETLPTSKPKEISSSLLNPPELQLPASINGKGVSIALIDSAVDAQHPDLSDATISNMDFVSEPNHASIGENHGTAIAGIIIADQESNLGVTGIASGAKLQAYRGCWELTEEAEDEKTNCNTLSLARALNAVVSSQPDILNLSLSGPEDKLLNELLTQIVDNGTHVITAYDPNRTNDNRFPSVASGVLVVYADHHADKPTNEVFSAPGSKVVASPGKRADLMHGHSIAAAYTSGILALCVQIEKQHQLNGICQPSSFSDNNISSLQALTTKLSHALDMALKPDL